MSGMTADEARESLGLPEPEWERRYPAVAAFLNRTDEVFTADERDEIAVFLGISAVKVAGVEFFAAMKQSDAAVVAEEDTRNGK